MNCEYCQSPVHIWFQCPKKPDGWKPARLAKRSTGAKARAVPNQHGSQVAQKVEQGDASVIARGSYVAGSIPALPVDTNSLQTQKASSGNADGGKPLTQTRPANSAGSSNGSTSGFDPVNAGSTPAPASKFDKKAWMKAYMKPYLRQYRQDVKSGKRTPKPRA